MKYRIIAALAVVVCFAVFFQNCGMQVRFASLDGKLLAKNTDVESEGELVPEGMPPDESSPTPTPEASATPNDSPTPTPDASATPNDSPTPTPEASATPTPTPTPDGPGNSNKQTPTPTPEPTATPEIGGNSEGGDGGPLTYVCVLEGPGRSILLGYIDNVVAASKSTPDTICTTKRGCLELVSQRFEVKEALEREYCSKNKHVVKATEDQLRSLLGL